MKKIYLKPEAEYVSFYSDEDIAATLDLGSNDTPELSAVPLPDDTIWE